jgi:diacylglycerol kinase family enzyme
MAGGDGSQALVADVARRHDVPFVCVPAGTRNHFALDLGLDRDDVAAALDAYGAALERRVDLAEVGGRVFVNNASIGAYATVVQADEYRDAKVATVVRLLPDLLGPQGRRVDLDFPGEDGARAAPADIVLVSNDPYRLNHLDGFGQRERLDAGTLGVVTVTVDRAMDVPALMAAEAAGRVDRFPGYREWSVDELDIGSAQSLVDVGVDGEALRLAPPLRFRSLPGALRVRMPAGAPARRAHVRPGAGRAVTELGAVLLGHPEPRRRAGRR